VWAASCRPFSVFVMADMAESGLLMPVLSLIETG
jgi:hypothetical protein